MNDPKTMCEGSGLPTRTRGGCDRCFAEDVRGEYVDPAPTAEGQSIFDFATFGHYVAKGHEAVSRPSAELVARWEHLEKMSLRS